MREGASPLLLRVPCQCPSPKRFPGKPGRARQAHWIPCIQVSWGSCLLLQGDTRALPWPSGSKKRAEGFCPPSLQWHPLSCIRPAWAVSSWVRAVSSPPLQPRAKLGVSLARVSGVKALTLQMGKQVPPPQAGTPQHRRKKYIAGRYRGDHALHIGFHLTPHSL